MFEELTVIQYPDPRLRQVAKPVNEFDERLKVLVARMFTLMRQHKGVGLAAPQVGIGQRVFVMNATGKSEDDHVYVNPELFDLTGSEEGEEGCLSLPEINAMIDRAKALRIIAKDVEGNPVEQTETGYVARIWQHEFDHLNGVLITDRMGDVARMAHRKQLRELEKEYEIAHPSKKRGKK
jgi:peptide deformylase